MELTKLVDILNGEIPGIAEQPSARTKLAQLYADRASRGAATSERSGRRQAVGRRNNPNTKPG